MNVFIVQFIFLFFSMSLPLASIHAKEESANVSCNSTDWVRDANILKDSYCDEGDRNLVRITTPAGTEGDSCPECEKRKVYQRSLTYKEKMSGEGYYPAQNQKGSK